MTEQKEKFVDTPKTLMLKQIFRDMLAVAVQLYELTPEKRLELGDMYWVTALCDLKDLTYEDRMLTACSVFVNHLKTGKIRDLLTSPDESLTFKNLVV